MCSEHQVFGNDILLRESRLRSKNVVVSTYPYHLEDTDAEI
jgi:hypothetical protein